MTEAKFQYAFRDLGITVSQIESLLGYDENGEREIVQYMIEEALKESEQFCNIRAEYKIYNEVILANPDKSLTVNNIHFNIQNTVFRQLKKTESVAVFVCTAGGEIGRRSREAMMDGDPLKGYILDVVGSVIVDVAADLMQETLAKSVLQSGQKITNRYSPGYCGWSVGEQHKLFQLIPDNFCGIRLTQSSLMDPVKSVSGIIGIGEHVKYKDYLCIYCEMTDCIYRGQKDQKKSR